MQALSARTAIAAPVAKLNARAPARRPRQNQSAGEARAAGARGGKTGRACAKIAPLRACIAGPRAMLARCRNSGFRNFYEMRRPVGRAESPRWLPALSSLSAVRSRRGHPTHLPGTLRAR